MINELVKVGVITQRYPERCTVKVKLIDVDDTVSYELPVVFRKTLKDKDYWMPDIDEHVVCLFSGQGLEQGFVLGAIYSESDKVPVSSNDKWHKQFEDGTVIEYDRKAKKLSLDLKGDCEIIVAGKELIRFDSSEINGKSLDEELEEFNAMWDNTFIKTDSCTILGLRCPFTGMPDHP
ncbi:MAG: phage baseplate assembly protein V [Nitrospinae bacterium]|nr:phage baseplate assembly protein V [Nitrospinota bacterium]